MLIAAGAKLRHLALVVGVVVLLLPVAYLKLEPFQQRRIDSWLLAGPVEDFHVRQAAARRDGRELTDAEKAAMIDDLAGAWRVRLYLAADYAKWWAGRTVPPLFALHGLRERGYYDRPYQNKLQGADAADQALDKRFDRCFWFVEDLLHGAGYHAWQAKVAVGEGGLGGVGFVQGSQTQNRLLDEAHTDFIFAVIAEEWGFLGVLIVIAFYLLIIVFGADVGLSTNEPYGKLLAVGVVALLAAQAMLNMAVTAGLMPVTGITLPFMSHGGSSLVASYLALALLCNVGVHRYSLNDPQPFRFRD
jgi:cell division protein FtsW (lipid II flippase)